MSSYRGVITLDYFNIEKYLINLDHIKNKKNGKNEWYRFYLNYFYNDNTENMNVINLFDINKNKITNKKAILMNNYE